MTSVEEIQRTSKPPVEGSVKRVRKRWVSGQVEKTLSSDSMTKIELETIRYLRLCSSCRWTAGVIIWLR